MVWGSSGIFTAQKLLGFEVEGGRKRRNWLAPFSKCKAAIQLIYEQLSWSLSIILLICAAFLANGYHDLPINLTYKVASSEF